MVKNPGHSGYPHEAPQEQRGAFTLTGVRAELTERPDDLITRVRALLRLTEADRVNVIRRSLDARKKDDLHSVWQLDIHPVRPMNRARLDKLAAAHKFKIGEPLPERPELLYGSTRLSSGPIVVGSGPAGLFCAWLLAREGYRPLLLERGRPVEARTHDVERYWAGVSLDPVSNVQFGEGGAGTFSDGKLTSRSKNPRGRFVLEIFRGFGAPDDIVWQQKPHIGTDVLRDTVRRMREDILAHGGSVRFETQVTNLLDSGGGLLQLPTDPGPAGLSPVTARIGGVRTAQGEDIPASAVVLAIGHSARDSYRMLHAAGLELKPKPFAVGLRVEHPQEQIDLAQLGRDALASHGRPTVGGILQPADYQLTYQSPETGRGVYTFCMCPGGLVVGASSGPLQQVVNGMSYRARDMANANSAVLCTVGPEDYGNGPLDGVRFQEELERKAWLMGQGFDPAWSALDDAGLASYLPPAPGALPARAPVQLLGDFLTGRVSTAPGGIQPSFTPEWVFSDLGLLFPAAVRDSLREALTAFGRNLPGFSRSDAVLTGVESRSSAPVRIVRDPVTLEATRLAGLYPVGEGAGYAGGIVSSAVDGLLAAEKIISVWKAPEA